MSLSSGGASSKIMSGSSGGLDAWASPSEASPCPTRSDPECSLMVRRYPLVGEGVTRASASGRMSTAMRRILAGAATGLAVAATAPATGAASGVALVDPFVGTAAGRPDRIPGDAAGGTTPAAAVPFGMVTLGPDTVPRGVTRGGGYAWEDRRT